MFCLRKKHLPASREDEIARLRPPSSFRKDRQRDRLGTEVGGESHTDDRSVPFSFSAAWASFTPLQSLRRTLSPYSIIYVRGTADGVVGRYMEEMENDDGHRDFEGMSRYAVEKRGAEREIEYFSWGDEG